MSPPNRQIIRVDEQIAVGVAIGPVASGAEAALPGKEVGPVGETTENFEATYATR